MKAYLTGILETKKAMLLFSRMSGDLATVLEKGSEIEKQLGELAFSVINTMTDRCGTNACVDNSLVKWRYESH